MAQLRNNSEEPVQEAEDFNRSTNKRRNWNYLKSLWNERLDNCGSSKDAENYNRQTVELLRL